MSLLPPKLKDGATIAVIAPAGCAIPERLDRGLDYLRGRGYQVRLGEHARERHGYFAGADTGRLHDLNQALRDPDISAIFCVRGGYGTMRLLTDIDYAAARNSPKIIVGYSDVTALHFAFLTQADLITFAGPMVAVEFGKGSDPFTEEQFWNMMKSGSTGVEMTGDSGPLTCLRPGVATGRLLGGNLAMICALIGTKYLPDFRDAILVLEDIGEEPYRMDRMFTQLRLCGILDAISGLILGQFSDCDAKPNRDSLDFREIIDETIGGLDIPIVTDLPFGHDDRKYTLPIGQHVQLNASAGKLVCLPDAAGAA